MTSFTIATWNVLATAYIRPRFYPFTPPACLEAAWRVPQLVRHAKALGTDVICLQEVETEVFRALESGLAEKGYRGTHALKSGKRPDGCATFFRGQRFKMIRSTRIAYEDGEPASGHVALLDVLELEGEKLEVLNTHVKWDPPGTPRERQWGYRQIRQAIESFEGGGVQILCGDLNAMTDSDVVQALREDGFDYAHREFRGAATCNSNREAKLIDYIFWRGEASVEAMRPAEVRDETPLPSPEQPSDHVPLVSEFRLPGRRASRAPEPGA